MNRLQRVDAVPQGRRPDRAPVSFWYHFNQQCVAGPRAVEAHVRHVEDYDLDFLKIMNDNGYPRPTTPTGVIADVADLGRLSVQQGDEENFSRQLELIGALRQRFAGELRMTTTIFNAWNVLRQMTAPKSGAHGPPTVGRSADPRDATMSRFLREAPEALDDALEIVAESLANFARHCLAAGADGIYIAVRDDWVDTPDNGPRTYDRMVRPRDLKILAAAQTGTFNILHVCGKALDFNRFASYPVHVLHWADRSAGPSIVEAAGSLRPAVCGGVDNLGTMVTGSPDDCARQVADAIAQAGARPILIAPGCTFDPQAVPRENLRAIRRAVETV